MDNLALAPLRVALAEDLEHGNIRLILHSGLNLKAAQAFARHKALIPALGAPAMSNRAAYCASDAPTKSTGVVADRAGWSHQYFLPRHGAVS